MIYIENTLFLIIHVFSPPSHSQRVFLLPRRMSTATTTSSLRFPTCTSTCWWSPSSLAPSPERPTTGAITTGSWPTMVFSFFLSILLLYSPFANSFSCFSPFSITLLFTFCVCMCRCCVPPPRSRTRWGCLPWDLPSSEELCWWLLWWETPPGERRKKIWV